MSSCEVNSEKKIIKVVAQPKESKEKICTSKATPIKNVGHLTPPTISSQTCDQKIRISSKYMMQG
jgi:hypothetical protein